MGKIGTVHLIIEIILEAEIVRIDKMLSWVYLVILLTWTTPRKMLVLMLALYLDKTLLKMVRKMLITNRIVLSIARRWALVAQVRKLWIGNKFHPLVRIEVLQVTEFSIKSMSPLHLIKILWKKLTKIKMVNLQSKVKDSILQWFLETRGSQIKMPKNLLVMP